MNTPVYTPLHTNSEPKGPDNKCPKCGHEWDDPPANAKQDFLMLGIIFVAVAIFLWGLFTVLHWLFPSVSGNPTLIEVIKDQWEWIASKRIW